jgi:hypothetical protein
MNRSLTISSLAVAAVVALVPSPAQALGPAFTCDAVTYQTVGPQLKIGTVDTSDSPASLVYTNVGAAHANNLNAGGYNPVDNFIYAMKYSGSGAPSLVKIASDGSYDTIGPLQSPGQEQNYVAGDVSPQGDLIIIGTPNQTVWSVDVTTALPTSLGNLAAASSSVDVGDFAIVTTGGTSIAYGFDTTTGALVSFPLEGTFAVTVNSTIAVGAGSPKGAVWTDTTGNLTTFVNGTGEVYSIENPSGATPTVSLIATGEIPGAGGNDGMKCALSESAFEPEGSGDSALADTGANPAAAASWALSGLALFAAGVAAVVARRSRRLTK